jgi:transposase InsO family protein
MPSRRPSLSCTIRRLLKDVITLIRLGLTSRAHLAAENLFLRKQLALYQERHTKPQRPDPATRVTLVLLSRWLDWRSVLSVVQPDTLIRWHRQGWRLFWRWTSRPGRPPIPADLRRLIVAMARANPIWGEERIANELLMKLGLVVSPRTVGRYLRHRRPSGGGRHSQRWATFVRNHAQAVLACDFFIVVTARFRVVYVFVVLEISTRRIIHWNVTTHPTADWTVQQFRAALTDESAHRFLIHDRDAIYAPAVDRAVEAMGLHVLKTPLRTPQANAFCERVIGTMRRECLDWLIPLNERHLRLLLREWIGHYNRGRPHTSLGPGFPDRSTEVRRPTSSGHRIPGRRRVAATPILGGLHHEYRLECEAA